MPRTYVPKPGAKRYKKYDEAVIKQALDELDSTNNSITTVAKKYNISKSVLCRHKTREMKPHGRPTALSQDEEEYIVENLNICGDWGYPLDSMDVRFIIKMYLDSRKIKHKTFKNNFPGIDYVSSFLQRHKDMISQRICQNIKRSRAAVSPEKINNYFEELSKSLEDVPSENIINYDETNLTDDPGRKKVIVRRGCKYPERVVNHTKGSVSLMMSATADGKLLPPYVVYKATYLYDSWTKQGPTDARYNRSPSGWFDGDIFADWIRTIVIPFFEKRPGKKILIGDNLSSHLSIDIIRLCKEKDIHFVFLPANSTHITQPLDVAFFRPMKMAWRQLLEKWKKSDDGRTQSCVPKGCFPRLLKLLVNQLEVNAEKNIRAGFRKCGIVPLDANEVLARLPLQEENDEAKKEAINDSFLKLLKEMRYGTMNIKEPKTKRKLDVVAGKSVSAEETENNEDQEPVKPKKKRTVKHETESTSNKNSSKGKGIGKKTKQQNKLPEIENKEINDNQNHQSPQIEYSRDEIDGDQNAQTDSSSGTQLNEPLNQHTVPKTHDENTIITELTDYDIETMPIIFADNVDCQEIIVQTDNGTQQEQNVQNKCKDDHNEKENVKLDSENKQEPKCKILSNIKLRLPLTKSKSNSTLKNIKKNKSTCPKTERRLSFYEDQDEILKILEGD